MSVAAQVACIASGGGLSGDRWKARTSSHSPAAQTPDAVDTARSRDTRVRARSDRSALSKALLMGRAEGASETTVNSSKLLCLRKPRVRWLARALAVETIDVTRPRS